MNPMRASRIQAGVLVVCLLTLDTPAVAAAGKAASPTVSYTYDSDGRLLTVTNAAGKTSAYSYDAAGNITGISQPTAGIRTPASHIRRRRPAPELGRLRVSAHAGSVLTLHGRHFSPDRSLDKVNIGRLIAPVLRASASSLTVRVPPGSGGTVAVLTPAGVTRNGRVTITGGPATPATPVIRAPGTGSATEAPPGVTALSGRVETAAGHPLAGVRVTITGLWGVDATSVTTGRSGWFLLANLAAGKHELLVNGTSVDGTDYGTYAEPLQLPGGRATVLPWITYLTPIDTAHAVTVPSPTTKPVVVTSPELPGVQVRIPKGTVIRDRDGHIVRKLSLTALPLKRTPFPLAPGMPDFFTLQPGDATFSGPGVRVTYPNVTRLPPGATVSYVALNPSWGTASWYQYGTGTVAAGGTQIVPATHTVFHQVMPFGYAPLPAPNPAPPPNGQTGGEPVDLFTGLYTMNATDLNLPDGLPAVLTRTYRDQDDVIRGFGLGMEDGFDWFVTPDPVISGDYALVLPNGSRIDYAPSSTPGVWDVVSNPAGFAGSVLTQGVDGTSTFIVTLKNGTVYVFGALEAFLIKETNQYGASLTISREEQSGDIQTVTTPGGKWMQFTYGACLPGSATDCVTQVTDDAGRTVTYSYDSNARLTGVTDANGGHTSYTWAPCTSNLTCTELLAITDPNKIAALHNTYDSTGAVTSQADADGGHWHYSYGVNGANDLTTVSDPRGIRTKWAFGPNGYPVSETAAEGTAQAQTTTFKYGAATNLLNSSTDALGRKTSYTYDSLGNLTSVTQLAGTAQAATTKFSYEPVHNRIASATNPDGDTLKLTYNDQARTITETDPLGHSTVITVNPSAQPVEYTDSLGNRTYLSYYDGDLITIADPAGDYSSAFYDGAGNALLVTDPVGSSTQATYNPLDEITSTTDPVGDITHLGYDPDGDLTSVTDPNGHTTSYTYTPMLRLASATDPLGRTATYSYDTLGNLTKTIDRNGTTDTFSYDALNRLTTAAYGANANAGPVTITAAYDKANRPTSVTETGGGTDTFSYDGLDDILTAGVPQGTISYTYDTAGRRLSMTAPGQAAVDYAYNRDGLPTTISQGTSKVSIGYDADLRVATVGLPGGITRTNTYDAASRITGIGYTSGGSSIGALSYAYTADAQVSTVSGTLAAITLPTPVTSSSFNADDELTSENGTTYSYDKQGNLTSDGASTYSWNALGQLTAISGAKNSSNTYDPFGRLATTTSAGATTSSLYDGSALIQQNTGTSTTNYLTGGQNDTYQEQTSAGPTTPLTDRQGSVIALTGPQSKITTRYAYTPSGVRSFTGAKSSNTLGYIGAPAGSTGLSKLGTRYYNPPIGQYISQNPAGIAGGSTDPYQYALDNPENFSDPSGPGDGFPSSPEDDSASQPGYGDGGLPGYGGGGLPGGGGSGPGGGGPGGGGGGAPGGGGGGQGGPGGGGGSCSSGRSGQCGGSGGGGDSGSGGGPANSGGGPGNGGGPGGGGSHPDVTAEQAAAAALGLAGFSLALLGAGLAFLPGLALAGAIVTGMSLAADIYGASLTQETNYPAWAEDGGGLGAIFADSAAVGGAAGVGGAILSALDLRTNVNTLQTYLNGG